MLSVPNCSAASSTASSTSARRSGSKPAGEVGAGELRLEAEADGHQRGVLRLLPGAVLDDGAEHGGEHHTDGDRQQQAERREAGQQTGSAQPAEMAHGPCIGQTTAVP